VLALLWQSIVTIVAFLTIYGGFTVVIEKSENLRVYRLTTGKKRVNICNISEVRLQLHFQD
jgi:hypothetical protein